MQYENPAFAFLTYDDEHHRFAFANMDMISPNGAAADVPDRMEFQVDCCANADEAHAFMYGEGFAANPIGVDIDAEALLAQYRGGASAESLLAMPAGPPAQIPAAHGLV